MKTEVTFTFKDIFKCSLPKLDIPEIFKSLQNSMHYKEESPLTFKSMHCREKIYEEFNRYDNINNKYNNALRKNNTLKMKKQKNKLSSVRI